MSDYWSDPETRVAINQAYLEAIDKAEPTHPLNAFDSARACGNYDRARGLGDEATGHTKEWWFGYNYD